MKRISPYYILFNTLPVLVFFSLFIFPHQASADAAISITLQNPIGSNNVNDFIVKVLNSVVLLLTPVVVIMFLWTGFLFVQAQGAPEKITAAKKALWSTLIGAALVLGASGLSMVIADTVKQL